jgi:hypothetical protein
LVLLACVLLLGACARSLTVAAAVTLPARAPVFVFPSVWVAGGKYEEEVYLLDRIATFLARDKRREVRRVRAEELEPARQAGQLSWLTAVVQLSLNLRSSERMHTSLMPLTYCGPFSCGLTSYGMYSSYVPLMRADVTLTVHEGPTARVLSRETFTDEVEGDSISGARQQLVERLAEQLEDGVDLHMHRKAFTLQQTGIRAVDDAIALLALGKYKQGRARLEAAAKALSGEKRQIQARALHALGVARVLAPSPGSSDLSDALRALRLAEQVDTRPRYRDTIRQVKELSEQVKVLAAQQQAYEHNFKLAGAQAGASSSAPESAPAGAPAAPPAPPTPVPPPAGK